MGFEKIEREEKERGDAYQCEADVASHGDGVVWKILLGHAPTARTERSTEYGVAVDVENREGARERDTREREGKTKV